MYRLHQTCSPTERNDKGPGSQGSRGKYHVTMVSIGSSMRFSLCMTLQPMILFVVPIAACEILNRALHGGQFHIEYKGVSVLEP